MILRKNANSSLSRLKVRRKATTCIVPLDPPAPSASSTISEHKALCLSLTEQLVDRGLLSSAWQVVERMIASSTSVCDAISVFKFASTRGIELEAMCYGVMMKKLVTLGHPLLAEALYAESVVKRGINPNTSMLNSMVICSCNLGKLEDAKKFFDELLLLNCVPCTAACHGLIKKFLEEGRILDAFDYVVRLTDARVMMSPSHLNLLIDRLCNGGYLSEAFQVFDILCEKNGFLPTIHLFKSLFYGLCKRGRVVEAESLFGEMESNGFFVDKTMYTSLINGYCKLKMMKMAMRVYFRMLKMGYAPDNYTYNTLIHGFLKLGLFDKGWFLYSQMVDWGLEPNGVTHHIMISQYCRDGKLDCALMLLDKMQTSRLDLPVHCYTALIAALSKENRFSEVNDVYKSMMACGVVPDHVMYITLSKGYPKGSKLQLAFLMLQGIMKNGYGLELSFLLTSSTFSDDGELLQEIELLLWKIVRCDLSLANEAFSIYISALCESGKTDDALCCLDKLLELGCEPLLSTYNSLIKCLCQEGLFETAKLLIELMEDRGVVPGLDTFLVMASELSKRRDLWSAFEVLGLMEDRGLKPNVAIYDSVIACLCREKRVSRAKNMFKEMLEDGVDPDEMVYMAMVNGYARNGRAIEACQLFHKMIANGIQPSYQSYTALISGLVKSSMTDKGCIYLHKMLEDGFRPNVVLYTCLIGHFLRKGEFQFAFRLVDSMERSQVQRDLVFYIELICGVCRNIMDAKKTSCLVSREHEKAREMLISLLNQRAPVPKENNWKFFSNSPEEMRHIALKLIQKMKEVEFMPNLYIYNGIILGFCRAGRMHDAYYHFEMMSREGLQPNHVTFTILIGAHIKSGEINSAVRLFNEMNASNCIPDRIACNKLLKGFCMTGRLRDALSLVYMMQKRGIFPNKLSYEFLLYSLCSSGLSVLAARVFEEMFAHGYIARQSYCNWLLSILCEQRKMHEAYLVFNMMHKRGNIPNKFTERFLAEMG